MVGLVARSIDSVSPAQSENSSQIAAGLRFFSRASAIFGTREDGRARVAAIKVQNFRKSRRETPRWAREFIVPESGIESSLGPFHYRNWVFSQIEKKIHRDADTQFFSSLTYSYFTVLIKSSYGVKSVFYRIKNLIFKRCINIFFALSQS
jgi:hypothetical protein